MKVLVWNVRRANDKRNDIWDYFLEIAPDIALLQEVGSLPSTISSCYSTLQRNAYAGNGKNQKFHTSVLVKGSVKYHHQRWWLEVLHLEGAMVLI